MKMTQLSHTVPLIGALLLSQCQPAAAAGRRGRAEEAHKGKWTVIADLTAGGGAKEVKEECRASTCLITCTDGSIIINTVVLRQGGKKTPFTVTSRLKKGESKEITIGDDVNVTGFRISDTGRGRYTVSLK